MGQTDDEMWDEEDGFFYDVLRLPDGSATRLRIRSMVGLIPLCAVSVIPAGLIERFPNLAARARENYERYADLLGGASNPQVPGVDGRHLFAILDERKLRKVLSRMLDEERFLSPHGIRSLSRSHLDEPSLPPMPSAPQVPMPSAPPARAPGRPGPPPSDGRRLTGAAGPRFQAVAAAWPAVVAGCQERPRLAMIDAR